ncbi:MAG: peptidylprolyl isomerase [Lysobacterales bacterium]|jgi:hypothetical protein
MARWLREPLLHFLLLGAAIFLLYNVLAGKGSAPGEIYVSRGQQQTLYNTFSRTWQRGPTAEEFQGLVRDYVRGEIAYREAKKMGLEENDIVIRRRLRQKLELLAEDVASLSAPTEQDLQAYLDSHQKDFMVQPVISLRQIYFSRDRRGGQAEEDARQLLERIANDGPDGNFEQFGDPLPLPAEILHASTSELSRMFGRVFTEGLQGIEPGHWAGPVASGYGLHLVFIEERQEGRVPELAEVRDAVQREWLGQRRREAVDALYDRLAKEYTVEIEPLTAPDARGGP